MSEFVQWVARVYGVPEEWAEEAVGEIRPPYVPWPYEEWRQARAEERERRHEAGAGLAVRDAITAMWRRMLALTPEDVTGPPWVHRFR